MIGPVAWLTRLLLAKGLSSGIAGWIASIVGYVLLALAILSTFMVAKCSYDKSVIKAHDVKVTAQSQAITATNTAASVQAVQQVTSAQTTIATHLKEQQNAIAQAPDYTPAAPDFALNCERLRQAGYREADLSARGCPPLHPPTHTPHRHSHKRQGVGGL